MIRYEDDKACGQLLAVFPEGSPVAVAATRARSYPALEGPAPDSSAAYELAASRLRGRARRVADLGAGAGAGARALSGAGFDVIGYECDADALAFARRYAPSVPFVHAPAEQVPLQGFDALVLIDVLGLLEDDVAFLRAMAEHARAGTTLVGAVVRAEVGQALRAPCRRAYSREQLDATLVRAGWTAPRFVGHTKELLVFECERAQGLRTARVLERTERAGEGQQADEVLRAVALAAEQTEDASEVRELLLALGALRVARGELDPAEQALSAANAVAPNCARPIAELARVALARGARDDAEALLDHALAFDAAHHGAWRGLATLFADRGETARAIECLECATALAPADVALALELARALSDRGDVWSAAQALDRVLPYGGASETVRPLYGWLLAAGASRGRVRGAGSGVYPTVHAPACEEMAS